MNPQAHGKDKGKTTEEAASQHITVMEKDKNRK